MPGSSLWLIPPPNSQFSRTLTTLITATIPYRFKHTTTHPFAPHVTLTSNIDPTLHATDPQAWLDSLDLPFAGPPPYDAAESAPISATDDGKLVLALDALETEDPFFRKLALRALPSPGLDELAAACRAQGVCGGDAARGRAWIGEGYRPHLSLMYAEMATKDVETKLPAVLQDVERARSTLKPQRDGEVVRGAMIVLVPTDLQISHWRPIASRELPDAIWRWILMA